MTTHTALINSTASAAQRLARALVTAAEVQYTAGPTVSSGGGGRSASTISNPTADIATDPRRLALRAAVVDGEVTLEQFVTDATAAAEALEEAFARWAGDRF